MQTLLLGIAEDAWNGDAQYQVTVDGIDAGGVLTASASHALGQSAIVTLSGNWGNDSKVDKFVDLMQSFGVTELTRTGKIAVSRK